MLFVTSYSHLLHNFFSKLSRPQWHLYLDKHSKEAYPLATKLLGTVEQTQSTFLSLAGFIYASQTITSELNSLMPDKIRQPDCLEKVQKVKNF